MEKPQSDSDFQIELIDQNSWGNTPYKFELGITPCHFGGHRIWFLCKCGRRCGSLYRVRGIFSCRQCHNLAYESQSLPRSGIFANIFRYKFLKIRSEKIRVPFWKGKLTKRAERLLNKLNKYQLTSRQINNDKMNVPEQSQDFSQNRVH